MIKKLIFILLIILFACNYNLESKIDTLFKDYNGKVPGASLLIIKNGEKILEKSYGLADIENNIKVTPKTNFRLASVTKQFTAMCILLLIEKGDLTLQTSLTDIFKDFPEYGKAITIKHLLQHTSGLIDYENLIPDTATIQVLDKDVFDMMKQQDSTYFEPGSQYKYSNSAYAVLAMIIEKVSGLTFAQYLQQNIFKPVGMDNTVALEEGISTVKNRAMGYAVDNDKFVFKDQSLTSAVLGDGGIYSSITDLFKWDQVLYTDKLISTKTLNQAFSKGQLKNGENIDYGFGWHLMDYKGHSIVYHTGSTCGFRNVIFRIPKQKFTVIILTNRDEPDIRNLAEKITDFYLF
jgi:CubicO group peptidase (beta-lactamase class C family)